MQTMTDLFLHFLKDMYYAEQQMLKSLPEMTRAAQNEALSKALSAQAEVIRQHVKTLNPYFNPSARVRTALPARRSSACSRNRRTC